jgi:hypothetical protein
MPFEARIESVNAGGQRSIRWACSDLKPPMLKQAAELFSEGMTVREVAAALRISKSEAGRLRLRALTDGILVPDDGSDTNEAGPTINNSVGQVRALFGLPACISLFQNPTPITLLHASLKSAPVPRPGYGTLLLFSSITQAPSLRSISSLKPSSCLFSRIISIISHSSSVSASRVLSVMVVLSTHLGEAWGSA